MPDSTGEMFDEEVMILVGQCVLGVLIFLSTWYVLAFAYHLLHTRTYANGRRFSTVKTAKPKTTNILTRVVLLSGVLILLVLIFHNMILYIPKLTMDEDGWNDTRVTNWTIESGCNENLDGLNSTITYSNWSCTDDSETCRQRKQCDKMCTVSMNTWWVLFVIAESAVYFYFWARMKLYYYKITSPADRSKCFTALVYICLVYLVAGIVFICWNYIKPYNCSEGICSERVDDGVTMHFIITTFSVFVGHVFILVLIASVVYKQRSQHELPRHSGSASMRVSQGSIMRLQNAIKKLLLLTSICVISDMVFMSLGFYTKDLLPRAVRSLFYESSLLINMFVVVFTFNNPKGILFPWTIKVAMYDVR